MQIMVFKRILIAEKEGQGGRVSSTRGKDKIPIGLERQEEDIR